jgi:ankyrin repeat protein
LLQNTPGLGAEYEVLFPAYFALRLNNNDKIEDFSIQSNVENFGNMDDVVIDILTKANEQIRFAIQLKHKDKKNTKLHPESLEGGKVSLGEERREGDFRLKKYCQAFKNLKTENKQCKFILYTNAKFDPQNITKVTKFDMIIDDQSEANLLFNTSPRRENVYRFEANRNTADDEGMTKSDYEEFLSRFTLFACQKNVEDIEKEVNKILEDENAAMKYIKLFRNWHQGRFTNKTIDRATVNVHLVDIFLSPVIVTDRYLPIGQNKKLKLFEQVVKEFDVTLINDLFENFVEHLTKDSNLEEGTEEKCECSRGLESVRLADKYIMRLAKESKMLEASATVLEEEVKVKVLQYASEKPLIVNFNDSSEKMIYKIMELLHLGSKIKFVLVGKGIESKKLTRFRIFEKLIDLSIEETLHKDVIRACHLSLQGRKEITLEELIYCFEEIGEKVEANEVFQMLKGNFSIGQEIERLPSFYINRKVSLKVLKIDTILDPKFLMANIVVINFDGKLEKTRKKFGLNVIDIHNYLRSTEAAKEPRLISTNEECSKQLLEDVSRKSDKKPVLHLGLLGDHSLSVVTNTKRPSQILPWNEVSIEENKIWEYLTRPINILCADPGTGKSTMLKKLKNECDPKFWTVAVDLKTHNEFLKRKHDITKLLSYLIERSKDSFCDQTRERFMSKKKVVFFFDGLDEIENNCVDNVLEYVEELLAEGFRVWVSTRKNLKSKLESRFGEFMIDMKEVDEEEQKSYIKNRLQEKYPDEEIDNMIGRVFSSTDIVNNCQILGIPLQLYIITQTLLDDKDLYHNMRDNIFVLTKMYKLFFHGRIKHNFDKMEFKHQHLNIIKPEDVLKKYEVLALESLFSNDVFKTLNVEINLNDFLNEIIENKDPLGIVARVNSQGKAVFEHYTYGEYFAGVFLANNFDKCRIVREELFSDRYKNLMMIFSVILAEENPLHLAVIYKDLDHITKHLDHSNIHDKGGRNPFHIAAGSEPRLNSFTSNSSGSPAETEDFLKNITILETLAHFDCNERDQLFLWSPLDYAIEHDCLVSMEIILKRYGRSKKMSQWIKKYKKHLSFYYFCLKHGCKNVLSLAIDSSEGSKNIIKAEPWTFIKHTIENCYFQESDTLRYLIKVLGGGRRFYKYYNGFEVNWSNNEGLTALHLAVKYRKTYAVKLLIAKRASVSAVTNRNETPLHFAAENGDVATADLLLERGASVNAVTSSNETPLHFAAYSKSVETTELLIRKGASVNAVTSRYNCVTSLHFAAYRGDVKIVRALIEGGASVNAVTDSNVTPLHMAAYNGKMVTARLLVEKGASVNVVSKAGVAPLHLAVYKGNQRFVRCLLEHGVDLTNVEIDHGRYPLTSAVRDGRLREELLLQLTLER